MGGNALKSFATKDINSEASNWQNPYLYWGRWSLPVRLGHAAEIRLLGSVKMSADGGMSCRSYSARGSGGSQWRGCAPGEPWKAVEVLAMVLGFIVFWPIGLAILGWKIWQKKSGYQGDILSFGREQWANWGQRGAGRWGFAANHAYGFGGGAASTGNRAFDEWRADELARLEEEYQRLAAAEREFAEFMDNLRHARDREEFERFMNERRRRQEGSA
jgi:hypothetical protein